MKTVIAAVKNRVMSGPNSIGVSTNKRARGFTLMEIMIVVAILAGIAVIAIYRFNPAAAEFKGALRKLTILTKELHNAARMNNRTYRLVMEMDDGTGHSIWVESAAKGVLLGQDAFSEKIDREAEKRASEDEENKAPPKPFSPDTQFLRKPLKFPKAVKIKEVEINGQKNSYSEGRAYLYFFPQGLTQEAAIHISGGDKLNFTLAINPITGHSKLFEGDRPLKDLRTE